MLILIRLIIFRGKLRISLTALISPSPAHGGDNNKSLKLKQVPRSRDLFQFDFLNFSVFRVYSVHLRLRQRPVIDSYFINLAFEIIGAVFGSFANDHRLDRRS